MEREKPALDVHLGTAIRRRSKELTQAWLERLQERLQLEPRRVFPTETLLNHIPELLEAVSDLLVSGGSLHNEGMVRDELSRLARLRRDQGYDVDEILVEFQILGDLLYGALREEARGFGEVSAEEALEIGERLYQSLLTIATITADTFRQAGTDDRRERARLLGNFGRDLAHELRNRLSTMQSALDLLEREDLDGAARERMIQALRRSFGRILGMADDVQSLSVAQGSEETAQGRRRPLWKVVDETLAEMRGLAEEKQTQLGVEGNLPDVQVDATRCELVLVNLIGNAIKYSDPKKQDRWTRISAEPVEESFWRITVEDNGIGIPDDMQPFVFERFVRAHPEMTDGTGLGLAIARDAVLQMGGKIWLESTPGDGTKFHFTLPAPTSSMD
jgi:signal transduction histidine kinase